MLYNFMIIGCIFCGAKRGDSNVSEDRYGSDYRW